MTLRPLRRTRTRRLLTHAVQSNKELNVIFIDGTFDRLRDHVRKLGPWRARDLVYVPTLEELIAACGDVFGEMARRPDGSFEAVVAKKKAPLVAIATACPRPVAVDLGTDLGGPPLTMIATRLAGQFSVICEAKPFTHDRRASILSIKFRKMCRASPKPTRTSFPDLQVLTEARTSRVSSCER